MLEAIRSRAARARICDFPWRAVSRYPPRSARGRPSEPAPRAAPIVFSLRSRLSSSSPPVASAHAVFGGTRGGGEPLAAREQGRRAAQRTRAFVRTHDEARALLKILHAERRRETRGARGRQHVIGARAIVTHRLGGVTAHEDRAGVADLSRERLRIGHRQFEMLG